MHRGFLLIFEQLLSLIQSHRQVPLLEQVLSYPHVKHFFRVVTQKIRVKKEGVRGIIYQNLFAAQKLAFKIQFTILSEWNCLRLDTKRAQELADKCIDSSKIKSLETFQKLVNHDTFPPSWILESLQEKDYLRIYSHSNQIEDAKTVTLSDQWTALD